MQETNNLPQNPPLQQTAVMRWVAVSEQTPETNALCLCATEYGYSFRYWKGNDVCSWPTLRITTRYAKPITPQPHTNDHPTRHPNPNPIRTDCDWCVYIVEIKAMTYQKIEKMALMVKFTDGIVRQVVLQKVTEDAILNVIVQIEGKITVLDKSIDTIDIEVLYP
jgi:hypothetical protein